MASANQPDTRAELAELLKRKSELTVRYALAVLMTVSYLAYTASRVPTFRVSRVFPRKVCSTHERFVARINKAEYDLMSAI